MYVTGEQASDFENLIAEIVESEGLFWPNARQRALKLWGSLDHNPDARYWPTRATLAPEERWLAVFVCSAAVMWGVIIALALLMLGMSAPTILTLAGCLFLAVAGIAFVGIVRAIEALDTPDS